MMTSNIYRKGPNAKKKGGVEGLERMSLKIIESYTVVYGRSIYLTRDDFIGISQGLAKGQWQDHQPGVEKERCCQPTGCCEYSAEVKPCTLVGRN